MTGGGRWIYDLETDGLLDTVSVIHCIALRNVETGEGMLYGPSEIQMALDILQRADEIIAHNGIAYDNEVIRMLHPQWTTNAKITDTLVLSRLIRALTWNMTWLRYAWRLATTAGRLISKQRQSYTLS